MYFSEDDDGESYPTLNFVNLDDKVTAMYETLSGLVVETETGKYHRRRNEVDTSRMKTA